uniref:Serine aminopeptidase S33 domain-containing protein n=1 Tax=Chenopodium quinoa TaxID=63459 RepID=A0A803N868_CHEQI
MAATNVEELTSGASGRIIPLFHRAKSMALLLFPSYNFLKKFIILFYSSFLCFLLLLLPRSQRFSPAEVSESEPRPAAKFRRRRLMEEEEDTRRRRALAEALEMMPVKIDGKEERESGEDCRWSTSIFFGVRRNALFCRSWFPISSNPKGIIIIIHGLNEHGGRYAHFARQLTSRNFGVYAMDWIGHGGSDGLHGFVPSLDNVVADTAAFLENVKIEHPGVPCFLFGHSTGGAVVLKAASYPHIERMVEGVILTSPALRVKPAHPVVKRGIPVSRDPAQLLAKYSDPLVYTGPIRVRTGHEILRITAYLTRNFKSVTVPFFVLHGTADRVTDPLASQDLYDQAASNFKDIKLYDGFLHDLLFEPEREEIAWDIIDWMEKRLNVAQYFGNLVD